MRFGKVISAYRRRKALPYHSPWLGGLGSETITVFGLLNRQIHAVTRHTGENVGQLMVRLLRRYDIIFVEGEPPI
jgi:hypothetical protein